MATCKDLPELTLNIVEDQNDVFRLLEVIKPKWKEEQVTIAVMSGGYSCCMLRCSHESGESVIVRVRNNMAAFTNPILELQVVKVLSSKGEFPSVLATFENGFCYEFIPGRPLLLKDAGRFELDENQLRLIARQMATIHSIVVPEFDYNKTTYFDFYTNALSEAKPWFDGCPDIQELKEELQIVKEFVSKVHSSLVLTHGDPHPANFVWNEDKNKITFVDWEVSQVAPRAIDVAYFVIEVKNFGELLKMEVTLPDNLFRKFCEYYLQRWNQLHQQPSPTLQEIEQLLLEVKYYALAVHLSLVVYFVRLDEVMPQFGNPEILFQEYFNRYLSHKEELTGMTKLGPLSS